MLFKKIKKKVKKEPLLLSYSFVDNSILLTTKTINKNGFFEIYRQKSKENSIQILCYNPDTEQFQAFDRFHWMDEPIMLDESLVELSDGPWKEDLWTPIKFHYTIDWLKEHIASSIN